MSNSRREASLRLRAGDIRALDDYHKQGRLLDAGTLEEAEQAAARGWLADTLAGQHAILVVDSNDQAARINAQLRAQLIALGRVDEHGVPLGREGTWAGVGDVVEARRLAWELAGFEGNRTIPVTRRHYRVRQVREDGALVVAPLLGHTPDEQGRVERLGESLVLPASYVAEDLTLGDAATVHAAEGLSVDSGHTVATPRTAANALYPGATRGRERNTVYVVTQCAPADAEPGEQAEAVRRNPRAVLARVRVSEVGAHLARLARWHADDQAAQAEQARADEYPATTPARATHCARSATFDGGSPNASIAHAGGSLPQTRPACGSGRPPPPRARLGAGRGPAPRWPGSTRRRRCRLMSTGLVAAR